MAKIRRKYTKAEKLEIVKLSLAEGKSVMSVSERFEIAPNTLYGWRKKYLQYEDAAFPGQGNKTQTAEQAEISRLTKALREAELERDILKKAVSIFSKNDRKFSNL